MIDPQSRAREIAEWCTGRVSEFIGGTPKEVVEAWNGLIESIAQTLQEARLEALEEAAKIAENFKHKHHALCPTFCNELGDPKEIAATIRGLMKNINEKTK